MDIFWEVGGIYYSATRHIDWSCQLEILAVRKVVKVHLGNSQGGFRQNSIT